MHEFGITQDLIDEVKSQAAKHNIRKVTSVEITLGKKSDLTPDSLKICFQALIGEDVDINKIPEHHHDEKETSHDHKSEINRLKKQNENNKVILKGCELIIKDSDDHMVIVDKIHGEQDEAESESDGDQDGGGGE